LCGADDHGRKQIYMCVCMCFCLFLLFGPIGAVVLTGLIDNKYGTRSIILLSCGIRLRALYPSLGVLDELYQFHIVCV